MRNIFVISDTHFFHANILKFQGKEGNLIRPGFNDVNEMNETIIENWNKTVADDDIVYHLGDFSFGKRDNIAKIASRLKGKKRLILGNHDTEHGRDIHDFIPYFDKIMSYRQFGKDMFKRPVVMCHFPLHWSAFDYRTDSEGINIHGHLHQNVTEHPYHVNVCVEHTKYTPVSIEEIVDKV